MLLAVLQTILAVMIGAFAASVVETQIVLVGLGLVRDLPDVSVVERESRLRWLESNGLPFGGLGCVVGVGIGAFLAASLAARNFRVEAGWLFGGLTFVHSLEVLLRLPSASLFLLVLAGVSLAIFSSVWLSLRLCPTEPTATAPFPTLAFRPLRRATASLTQGGPLA